MARKPRSEAADNSVNPKGTAKRKQAQKPESDAKAQDSKAGGAKAQSKSKGTANKKAPATPVKGASESVNNRRSNGQFGKGNCGNPGGRPKVATEVRELARQHSDKAVKRLVELMDAENETVAVKAAQALLDRAWGKPTQYHGNDEERPLTPNLTVNYG